MYIPDYINQLKVIIIEVYNKMYRLRFIYTKIVKGIYLPYYVYTSFNHQKLSCNASKSFSKTKYTCKSCSR